MPKKTTPRRELKSSVSRIEGKLDNGKAKAKGTVEKSIRIAPIQLGLFTLPILGITELVIHRFGPEVMVNLAKGQDGTAKQKKGKRKPSHEYEQAMYVSKGKRGDKKATYGIPAAGFKNAAVSACRYVDGIPMTIVRGAMFVRGDSKEMDTGQDLVTIISKAGPYMRTDPVRLSGPSKSADLRYRPGFLDWRCDLEIEYNSAVLSPEEIVNLFNNAGFGVGVCEWRPERNGSYGQFQVDASRLKVVK